MRKKIAAQGSFVILAVLVLAAVAAGRAAAAQPTIKVSVITDQLHVSNVVPTWGAQIPKIAFDGQWYYAAALDSDDDAKYPWRGIIYKSPDGENWSVAVEMRDPDTTYICNTCSPPSTRTSEGVLYQPAGLLFDNQNRLHMQVGCWNGGECFPGIPSPPGDHTYIYTLRLMFSDRLPDGSIDFTSYEDHSLREGVQGGPPISRYYQGMSLDPTGRYIYVAFAGYPVGASAANPLDSVGPVWFNSFDTQTGQDVFTEKIADNPTPAQAPPAGRAWIYFRVRPGLQFGEVYLSFEQVVLGEHLVNSAPLDAAWLWRSTDGGHTFPERVKTVEVPYADGYTSWVDSTDSTVDSHGTVHAISYKRVNSVSTTYYQQGMYGTPVDIGRLDNHSQLVVTPEDERLVFSNQGFLGDNYLGTPEPAGLVVASSPDGVAWSRTHFPTPQYKALYWPNLAGPLNGSAPLPHAADERRVYGMMVGAQRPNESAYSTLLFVRYAQPASTTAVTVSSFGGQAGAKGVTLTWKTASEAGLLGFNVWRYRDGQGVRVNRRLVAARAVGAARVTSYHLVDRTARPGAVYTYRLQLVRSGGEREWSRSVTVGSRRTQAILSAFAAALPR